MKRLGVVSLAALLSATACDRSSESQLENATPSPNASILPAPLSSAETPSRTPGSALERSEAAKISALEGGTVVPLPMRVDQALEDDVLPQKDVVGVSLQGEWRYADPGGASKSPEVNQAGVDAARKLTAPRLTVDLSPLGRMRVVFASRGLPLRRGTELRARTDRYGHVLVWPDATGYRVLPVGASRTLLGERRIDAIPLVRPVSSVRSEGARRLGYPTRKWDVATRSGKMSLETARIAGAGESGVLLCRFLSELIALDPEATQCSSDEVPLRAQYTWPRAGGVTFEAVAISEKAELSSLLLAVPPAGSEFTPGGSPPDAGGVFLTSDELAAFRLRAAETAAPLAPGAPRDGLLVHNGTDVPRYLFLDAVPVAWIDPNRDQLVLGPPRGHYQVQWRTFLGESSEPPITIDVPSRVSIGGSADGGH